MRFFQVSDRTMKLLRCVVVFLIFCLIVLVPWLPLLATTNANGVKLDVNNALSDILQMFGGGGIGVAGSSWLQHSKNGIQSQSDNPEPSGFNFPSTTSSHEMKQLERRWLQDSKTIRDHQKKLQSKLNAIEFFLGKKFEDFNRKDTYH